MTKKQRIIIKTIQKRIRSEAITKFVLSQRHVSKGDFPRETSQGHNFPSGNFPNFHLKLGYVFSGGRSLWLGWAKSPSATTRTGKWAERCGQEKFGKFPILEFARENTFGKVPNIYIDTTNNDKNKNKTKNSSDLKTDLLWSCNNDSSVYPRS